MQHGNFCARFTGASAQAPNESRAALITESKGVRLSHALSVPCDAINDDWYIAASAYPSTRIVAPMTALKRDTVHLSGRLRGRERDVACNVIAERVSLSGGAIYEYIRPMIADEPADLPNGVYTITFDGRTSLVQRLDGAWIASTGWQSGRRNFRT